MNSQILIVDDDEAILRSLTRLLRPLKLQLHSESSVQRALALCETIAFDLIISDQRMPEMEGTAFLKKAAQLSPNSIRFILSGYADFDHIITAFNEGVIHKFIDKPWDNEELLFTIKSLLSRDQTHSESKPSTAFHGMVSNDPAMQRLFKQLKKLATANAPIFIHGETGTGKELAAKAIHQESYRQNKSFIAVNCANFTEQMMAAELFGHKKGAFTGAINDRQGLIREADGGTLFLDEVTSLPLDLQAKLLRVLQERCYREVGGNHEIEFDVQLISASSELISGAVARGTFREDLQYRLDILPLNLPPLRERGGDARLIFDYFIHQLGIGNGVKLSNPLKQFINSHAWPGNVRQLYNTAQYVAAMFEGDVIDLKHLPAQLTESDSPPASLIPAPLMPSLNQLTSEALSALLEKHQGNRTATASTLGVSRMTLWRKMNELQVKG